MSSIQIKKVSLAQLHDLEIISRKTFTETFADTNSAEDMQKYLKESLSSKKLEEELKNPGSEFYFAIAENKVIGYLKVNYGKAQTELKDSHSLEIERIYVLKEFHGAKVGQVLYNKALDLARQSKVQYVWLGVWEKNPRAINFYKKNGFIEFNKHIFKLGNDEQTDIMMRLALH